MNPFRRFGGGVLPISDVGGPGRQGSQGENVVRGPGSPTALSGRRERIMTYSSDSDS